MIFEEALKELEKLMERNKDVLIRLKNCEGIGSYSTNKENDSDKTTEN